ncbi:MAG: hypothetical protein COA44_00125 [Arcobacter sp.]|nr:MAG: hypothetical protein COA44_00125 [Arcobacter sp.]
MKTVFFLLISCVFLQASTISLNEIIEKLKNEHPLALSIDAYADAYTNRNQANLSRKALSLIAQGAYAEPIIGASDYEYSIGVSQKFMNSSMKDNALKSANYQSDAKILDLKYEFMLLENEVGLLYHLNCIDKKATQQYETYLSDFKSLYKKKEKAYQYGEISKIEFLHLQIELDRLKNDFKHYKNEEKISRIKIQSKILISSFEAQELFCEDTYSLKESLILNPLKQSLQEQSVNKKIQSAESEFSRYDTFYNSFTLSASYQEEIDVDRFIIGLSVPLNFSSSENEKNRAASLFMKSALKYKKQEIKLEQESKLKLLNKQLGQDFQDIELITSILNKFENELMPLIERGYDLGENSAIEYLLSRREMWTYKKDQIEEYKNYYITLFKLYSVTQSKE